VAPAPAPAISSSIPQFRSKTVRTPTRPATTRATSEPCTAPPATRRFTQRKLPANDDPLDEDDDFDDLFAPDAGRFGGAESEGRFGGRMRPGMGGGRAGGMMRGRGRQEPQEKELGPTQFPLFNPDLLFRVLYSTLWPLKFVIWTMLPLTVFAELTSIQNMPQVTTDLAALMGNSDLILRLLIALFVANLGPRIAQGVAITAQGGRVKGLGILAAGVFAALYIDDSAIEQMDRKGQMWAPGASLLFHLSVFVFGILIWAGPRDSGGIVPLMTLTVAKFGLIMFLITAWPLIPVDGMRFMGAALGEPKLLAQSLLAARWLFVNGRMPTMIRRTDAWPLAPFAVGPF